MIDLHLSAFAPRWRFLYAVRIDAYRTAGRAEGPYKRFSEKNLGAGRIDFARASPMKRAPARPDRVGNGRTVGSGAVTEIDE